MSEKTPVEVVKPVHVQRDDPDPADEQGQVVAPDAGEVETVPEEVPEELVEAVVVEDPPEKKKEPTDREAITENFNKKHRSYTEPGANPGEENAAGEEKTLDTDEAGDNIDPENPEMVTIKVNQREIEVPKSKVDAAGGVVAYQKEVAVHQGFRDVKIQKDLNDRRSKELDDRETLIKQTAPVKPADPPELDDPALTDPTDPPVKGDPPVDELAKQYHTALLDGDEELALSLHGKLNQANQTTQGTVDPDQIAQNAAKIIETNARTRLEREAVDDLFNSHPELRTDDRMYFAVDGESDVVEQEHPDWNPKRILEEAYRRISKWKGVPQTDSMAAKMEVKRALNRPRASTGRAVAPPADPPKTKSDYVKEERVRRGLDPQ